MLVDVTMPDDPRRTAEAKRRPPVITPDTGIDPDVDLDQENVRLRDGTRLTNELAQVITEDVHRAVGRSSLAKHHGTRKDPFSRS
jgi:hypothetical protein